MSFFTVFDQAQSGAAAPFNQLGFSLQGNIKTSGQEGLSNLLGVAQYHAADGRGLKFAIAPVRLEFDLYLRSEPSGHWYTVDELHALESKDEYPNRTVDSTKVAHDAVLLQIEMERLVSILVNCGTRFFDGDVSLWNDLRAVRAARHQQREDSLVLQDADMAWREKDWVGVVKLLGPLRMRLGRLHQGKLSYAENKAPAPEKRPWWRIWK